MTTYNTYQEAKIANPKSEIFIKAGKFIGECDLGPSPHTYEYRGIAKCNPADHCMTVEQFLEDGHKFVEGDWILNAGGGVITLTPRCVRVEWNDTPHELDNKRYILRAAALEEKKEKAFWEQVEDHLAEQIEEMVAEEKKPRTKVEYVKSDIESRGRALDAFDGEVELFELVDGEYKQVTNESDAISRWRNLYECIETPMTWKEELYDYLDSSCEMSDDFDDSFTIEIEGRPLEFNLNDDEFVDMCKLVASLNSVN